MSALPDTLDPSTYVAHPLHRGEREWAETNCYVDVWIELLHALGSEPLAGLGFTLRTDLEADQWTFFKFPHDELFLLFGIDVFELNPWHSVVEQTANEVRMGRVPLVEVDAHFLPDTAGTTYRTDHGKTTIGITSIDTVSRAVSYFHNAGFHAAEGDDFVGLFPAPEHGHVTLAPYIEVAKPSAGRAAVGAELVDAATGLLRRTLRRAPSENPFTRYAKTFPGDLDRLREGRGARYHAYAFANFRQFGAAFFLAAMHLTWLRSNGFAPADPDEFDRAVDAFADISSTAKSLQFQTARAAFAGKNIDASSTLTRLEANWETGMSSIRRALG